MHCVQVRLLPRPHPKGAQKARRKVASKVMITIAKLIQLLGYMNPTDGIVLNDSDSNKDITIVQSQRANVVVLTPKVP